MRLFELITILLLIALLIGRFYAIPSNTKKVILTGSAIALLLHISLEGIRWQLTIVYLLSVIVIINYFLKVKIRQKWLRLSTTIFSLILILISSIIGYLVPVFKLPTIKGDYLVGTTTHVIDTKSENTGRIDLKAWYPIGEAGTKKDVYCDNPITKLDDLMGMPGFLFSHLTLVQTSGYRDVSNNSISTKFPLVIYAHGAASTNIDNTALLQEIASHGYIVISVDFDFSFEKYELSLQEASILDVRAQQEFVAKLMTRVVPVQSAKIIAVIEQLKNENLAFVTTINFNQIALIGHSLGGTTCANIDKNRLKPQAIINIDGPMPANATSVISCPFLYLSSYSPDLPNKDLEEKGLPDADFYRQVKKYELENVSNFFEGDDSIRHWVRFANAGHIDFTDLPYMIPMMASNGYEKGKGHYLKCEVILHFLNCYLKNEVTWSDSNEYSMNWLK